MRTPLAAACVAACLLLAGCPAPKTSNGSAPAPNPAEPRTWPIADLGLDKPAPAEMDLMLRGTKYEVESSQTAKEGGIEIAILVRGEELEREKYELDSTGFRYLGSASETFRPAIPLVRGNLTAPDQWDWAGQLDFAGQKLPAKATVTSVSDTLNLPGGPFDSIKVQVALEVRENSDQPAMRTLTFWIAKGQGIVKRDFNDSSTRQPRGST